MTQATSLRRGESVLIAIATLALLLASWNALSGLVFYSSDTGLRFLQVHNLVSQGWQTFAIDYPARTIDPDLRYVPYYSAFSLIHDDLYLNIAAGFPLLASFLYALFGAASLCVIPVAGSLATAWATAAIARELGLPRPPWVFLATLSLTPMAFYGMVFWDHSAIAALSLWGVYHVVCGLRRGDESSLPSLRLGGALIGIATTQRPEIYPFAAAVAVGIFVVSRERWRYCGQLAIGGVLGAAPIWLLQYFWVGHPLGMATAPHLSGGVETPPAFSDTLHRFLAVSHPKSVNLDWAATAATAGAVVLAVALRWSRVRSVWSLALGFGLAAWGYGMAALHALDVSLSGIAITFALLPLSLTSVASRGPGVPQSPDLNRLLALITLGFFLLVVTIWPFDGGLQWGVRYLLPLYPLLLVLALHGYETWRRRLSGGQRKLWHAGASALLALALVTQGLGLQHVNREKPRLELMRSKLLEMSVPFIITDHAHLPSFLTSLVPLGTSFVRAKNDHQMEELLTRFAALGGRRIGFSPSRRNWLHIPERVGDIAVRASELKPHGVRRIVLELQ